MAIVKELSCNHTNCTNKGSAVYYKETKVQSLKQAGDRCSPRFNMNMKTLNNKSKRLVFSGEVWAKEMHICL